MLDHFPLNRYPHVILTPEQIESGRYQATKQDLESARFGRGDKRGLTTNQAQRSLQGALGEVAAHVYLNLPFEYSINKHLQPDLITNRNVTFDVKTSASLHMLYVPDEHVERGHDFLFVHSRDNQKFYMLGYLRNSELPRFDLTNPGDRYNSDGSPAFVYAVPFPALHPIPRPSGQN